MAAETPVRPCVLVVEDNRDVADLIMLCLEDEGFTVCRARDGHAALAFLTAVPPSARVALVVLDMMLPSLDGAAVLAALPQQGIRVPVIAMSASPVHLPTALAAGAVAALAKPFDLVELVALVERYCPRAAPP